MLGPDWIGMHQNLYHFFNNVFYLFASSASEEDVLEGDEDWCHYCHGNRALISVPSISQGPIENDVMIHVALIAESQR